MVERYLILVIKIMYICTCGKIVERILKDLVNGYSSGNSNFISFSPISYRGQKYYYDYCDCILAYDTIYDNSFICSSLSNMGSNYCMVEKNSAVVADKYRNQRGILETSSVKKQNAETLLYREGLKPCGIILANGKRPNSDEIMYHKRYNLPFIITQKKKQRLIIQRECLLLEMVNMSVTVG